MTATLAAVAVGFLVGRLLWLVAGPVFSAPVLLRANHRGRPVPTAAGALLVVAAVVVEAGRALAASVGVGRASTTGIAPALLVAVVGFGLLGLIDDILGDAADRGFKGHLRALADRRVTTGMLKLLGGAAVALVAVFWVSLSSSGGPRPGRLMADAALVALAANLGNLFDRAPGRVIKVATAGFVFLAAGAATVGSASALVGVAVVVGSCLSLLGGDLSERLMLGDAGANVLGAALGMGVVLACGPGVRTAVLGTVVALNLAGEVVSFSRVIDAVPPLRALDRAGRLP